MPTSSSRTSRRITRRVTERATSRAEIVVLAGGKASRLAGKLFKPLGGTPMLARVVTNLMPSGARSERRCIISTSAALEAQIREMLAIWAPHVDADFAIDEAAYAGPRAALLQVARANESAWLFLAAGDMPFIDLATVEYLEAAREATAEEPGAVVARADGRRQPLGALYRCAAVLAATDAEDGSLHALLDALSVVECEEPQRADRWSRFVNINDPESYEATARAVTHGEI